ncbi:phosphatidylserine decarboxylase [Aquimarina brevivitae]|uniref:Phosphatidylserine decarboxylase n=1 Tax=Aquimarina brevivitae TaxID=323412 RepID=A0A4Q7PH64_9FLAO|nr:phosphatidylserine decarboxylase [Aquimarina brevivitae]RZS99487.1 phosphatidylserine decarboxylase precursor [Aquimarina brevivitae]
METSAKTVKNFTDLEQVTTSYDAVEVLRHKLQQDKHLSTLLNKSIVQAKIIAAKTLDSALFQALQWPMNNEEYLEYLTWFARWTPNQSGSEAWKRPGHYDQNQEVYDRLCHFYWLIDQEVSDTGSKLQVEVQNSPWFSKWLVVYANLWGSFLDTPASFNDKILESFIKNSPQYNVEDSMITDSYTGKKRPNAPSGWLTFNQFFARELNPGLRPINVPNDNTIITAPADCTYKATYPIDANSEIKQITIKQTHSYGSIEQLLDNSPYKDDFANGTFVHYFLGPYDYHRFHTPVAGEVLECRAVRGKTYLNVDITDQQFDAPDGAEDGYEFYQARGIVVIDTKNSPSGDIGKVAIIPVGMCQVSSVNMIAQQHTELLKGDEFGYFLFGGSDIIMLFQEGINLQLNKKPIHHNYGTKVGVCTTK